LGFQTILVIIGLGVIELVGLLVYLEALGSTEISIASPLKKTKPVLIAVLEPFILGIVFNPILIVAASLTGVGGFVVLSDNLDWKSLRNRLGERGPKLAVLAALIYTVLSLGSRFGNEAVGPFIFGGVMFTTMMIGYYFLLKRLGQEVPTKSLASKEYALIGFTGVGRSVFVWGAYALASATVVTSVTQLTILLDVVIGGHLFSEGNLRQKTIGSLMILVGVIVVVFV
jgi:drug/metabolite transporter (DMT)-like permease